MITLAPFQRLDYKSGLVMPWFTHGALDDLTERDFTGKVVLEWGGGYSTKWWASRADTVYTIEHVGDNPEWWTQLQVYAAEASNIHLLQRGDADYTFVPSFLRPDIVIVDGCYRTECIREALRLIRPLTLIVDNWQQPGVYTDEAAAELLSPFDGRIYAQEGYAVPTHMPWQTGIWEIR